jgi:hypothetical protein
VEVVIFCGKAECVEAVNEACVDEVILDEADDDFLVVHNMGID